MSNTRHLFKIADGTGWLRDFTSAQWNEGERRGLVEHDENCWCNVVDDNPPFM